MISDRFKIFWNGKLRDARYSTGKDLANKSWVCFLATMLTTFVAFCLLAESVDGVMGIFKSRLPIRFMLSMPIVALGLGLALAFANLIYFRIKNERHKKW